MKISILIQFLMSSVKNIIKEVGLFILHFIKLHVFAKYIDYSYLLITDSNNIFKKFLTYYYLWKIIVQQKDN